MHSLHAKGTNACLKASVIKMSRRDRRREKGCNVQRVTQGLIRSSVCVCARGFVCAHACSYLWERTQRWAAEAVRWPKPVGSARHWGWREYWPRYSFLVLVSLVGAAGLHGETPERGDTWKRRHTWVKRGLHASTHTNINAHCWLEAASLRFTQGGTYVY